MTIDDYAAKYGEDYPFVKQCRKYKELVSDMDIQTLHIGYLWGQEMMLRKENERLITELGENDE